MSDNRIIDALIAQHTEELEKELGPDWMSKIGFMLWNVINERDYYEDTLCQT